jgi:hypothetical protein
MRFADFAPLLAIVVLAAGAIWLAVRLIRWAKKGTRGGAMLAAAAFPFPDKPPPGQQAEDEARRRKDTDSGAPPE